MRLTRITLPDRSLIEYSYDPVNLNAVVRNGKTHRYHCDLAGNVLSETLFQWRDRFLRL